MSIAALHRLPRLLGFGIALLLTFGESVPNVWAQQDNDRAKEPNTLTAKEKEEGFVLLFDGKTLEGWKGNQDVFRIQDGALIGGSLKEPVARNEFLRTTKEYEDFELRLQFRLLGQGSNAGVQIRTQEIENHHEVRGYQADMGNGWWGCLYDESRRNRILAGPPTEERDTLVKPEQWNDYRIRCQGNRIQLWINGKPTVDYHEEDKDIPSRGIIAVQIHGGPPSEAHYRSIRIRKLKED